MVKRCELCGRLSDDLIDGMILTSPKKLEDFKLCGSCVTTVNNAKNEEEEIELVRKLRDKL